ncbi:MAG: Glucose-1-phosphate adenylyltransferase [Bacteroidia bacterium]|nr:CBS domain-containing protein [Zoogloeaceae bacterium]MCG3168346.1 Glucose-1-phosphate adenylyltransferase [Bacteroidia bacterium]MCK6383191.1 nucleotidyltransferase family protein [Rhodocyclaceae bacterium]
MKKVSDLFVPITATLRDVLMRSEKTRRGIVLVVDDRERLLGVVTDGDIRRAFLSGTDQTLPVRTMLEVKVSGSQPITAPADSSHGQLVALLRETGVSHVPLVDGERKVVGLVCLDDLLEEDETTLQAVVMAGGRGTRLHPLTEDMPKPMLPVGDRPLMERIIRQLSETGIRQVSVTTHFRAEKISEYFGDGQGFGVNMNYIAEDRQLGTAGGLALMAEPESTLLVVNGDILTEMDFRVMQAFHREHRAALTIAVRQYEVQVPYGVVESEGVHVSGLVEKPVHKFFVNAGIYLLEPEVHRLIPKGIHFDMTDLIREAMKQGMKVVSFPIWEYWRDIGQHQDYVQAQADVKNGTLSR